MVFSQNKMKGHYPKFDSRNHVKEKSKKIICFAFFVLPTESYDNMQVIN